MLELLVGSVGMFGYLYGVKKSHNFLQNSENQVAEQNICTHTLMSFFWPTVAPLYIFTKGVMISCPTIENQVITGNFTDQSYKIQAVVATGIVLASGPIMCTGLCCLLGKPVDNYYNQSNDLSIYKT